MDRKRFWDLIRAAKRDAGSEDEAKFDALKGQLLQLPPEEILSFDKHFGDLVSAAYGIDLWGAASLINGGASDDGFHYFLCWLVGMGQKVYEKAIADPDSLADVVKGDGPFESDLEGAAARAWTEKTGRSEDEFYAEQERLGVTPYNEDEGEDWDFDDEDEMRRRLPRLSRLYLDAEE